jgi:hypothetical protein
MKTSKDYLKAKELGLTDINARWGNGIDHHFMSKRIMKFLQDIDYNDCDDSFCWKCGGDGDNGEELMYQLDAFFELMDKEVKQ